MFKFTKLGLGYKALHSISSTVSTVCPLVKDDKKEPHALYTW